MKTWIRREIRGRRGLVEAGFAIRVWPMLCLMLSISPPTPPQSGTQSSSLSLFPFALFHASLLLFNYMFIYLILFVYWSYHIALLQHVTMLGNVIVMKFIYCPLSYLGFQIFILSLRNYSFVVQFEIWISFVSKMFFRELKIIGLEV